MGGIFLWVLFEDFALLRVVPGAMKKACFVTSRRLDQMPCILFLVLSGADLIRFGRQGVLSSINFPTVTGTVGLYSMIGNFVRCSSCIDLLCNFHAFKHVACIFVGIYPVVPYLQPARMGITGELPCSHRDDGNLPLRWENMENYHYP